MAVLRIWGDATDPAAARSALGTSGDAATSRSVVSADHHAAGGVAADPGEIRDGAERHQRRRLHLPALHIGEEIGSSPDHRGSGTIPQHRHGLLQRRRGEVGEGGKAHQDAKPSGTATLINLPKSNSGNESGPTRPLPPLARSRTARTTLSG